MICFPNAKVNIGLYVTEKRDDGYHNIETLFFPIQLKDVLEIIENEDSQDDFVWSNSGILVDAKPEDNLCVKALMLLKQDYNIPPVKMHLHKVIPFGAGLGGGSADAAFTLTTLNEMFGLGISLDKLHQYAASLGADCAFFIDNRPCMASGIGDVLTPFDMDLKGYHLLLVKPNVHVSTPEAYGGITPGYPEVDLKDQLNLPVDQWKGGIGNDFESSVFPKYPSIGELKAMMYAEGAMYASMTGSGAAVFGLFAEKPQVNLKHCFVWTEVL
ncbi:4-(cytidine 5'-diphospho)-2-C-methyl-D-erythritol kinase [Saccharicrinis fermentans]|uniref:4-diphosphocytidyl-2-C-methyl-D-erythritol kinase n=1 Tax=Saccharicrinis fermentans DSM 9555 = JCM 21142 TaxID=869213 RepID=W7Y4M6_9BACT|nr:4-(cytidine 5'-diphospho)-2-C-methyl-D-erythritol kinase [Saccharicrinis fermentans]GAF02538.1 4-diphosphocytidyl-2-C-methyl-D-erythritol kinase [Saccharicrinis fermentans DSM 9555 = JCM 21142]